MLETLIRPNFDRICVTPMLQLLSRNKRISPNFITLLSVVFGLAVVPLLYFHLNGWAAVVLLLSGYCDMLDGSLARKTHRTSAKGAMYDICADRLVEGAVILGLFLVSPERRALLSILMLIGVLLCVASFLVAAILQETSGNKAFYYSPGLMERAEAFCFFLVMIILPASFVPLAFIFIILVFYTAAVRIFKG